MCLFPLKRWCKAQFSFSVVCVSDIVADDTMFRFWVRESHCSSAAYFLCACALAFCPTGSVTNILVWLWFQESWTWLFILPRMFFPYYITQISAQISPNQTVLLWPCFSLFQTLFVFFQILVAKNVFISFKPILNVSPCLLSHVSSIRAGISIHSYIPYVDSTSFINYNLRMRVHL